MPDLTEFSSAFLKAFDAHRLDEGAPSICGLSIDEAYSVQQLVIEARLSRGERAAGYKVGCTSSAIRRQFGLDEPICGRVMEPHVHRGNASVKWGEFFQPAVEPEFVLRIGRDLNDEVGDDEPLEGAIEWVSPGIEIHSYHFWFGTPMTQELIASNGLHAALVIGEQRTNPREVDWEMEGVGLFKGDQLEASGIGAEIMETGPMTSLRWLVNHLVRRGGMLKAGDLVIPGSPVELIAVGEGESVTARFTRIGEVSTAFVS
ncbi:MAG: hypothetical protein CMJ48_07410 [Planctomycetaceae bacterium]|nr:hypothetical protein [Planctomycetaceae bacterium]